MGIQLIDVILKNPFYVSTFQKNMGENSRKQSAGGSQEQ